MSYRIRLPIAKNERGVVRNEAIERIEVERASAGGTIIEAVSELPRPVPGQILYFYNVPGYDNGLYYYNGVEWIQLDNTDIDVQAFTVDGTGNVWDDLNVTSFTGQTDAQPDGTVLIDTHTFVTFYHDDRSWAWGGPRPVYVGVGGDHVAVEADLQPLGVANIVTSVHTRIGDVVGEAGDYTYDQVGADPAGSAAGVQANLDTHEAAYNPHAKVTWKGEWAGGQYVIHDMVTDSGWLSIANKTTTERSSVQPIGSAFWPLEGATGWTLRNPSGFFVASGQDWTLAAPGYLSGYKAYFPVAASATITYTFLVQDITDPNNVIDLILSNPTPSAEGWLEVTVAPVLRDAGDKLRFALAYEDNANETTISARYDYTSDNNDVTPLVNGDAHRRLNRTWVRFFKTDLDGNAGAIDAVPVGATITVDGASDWDVIAKADGGTYWEFTITGTGNPIDGIHQFDFTYPVSARPQLYYDIPGYWTANPPTRGTVQGYLNLDGVVTLDDTAYAVDLRFQEAYIPTDWDQLANSETGGGSSGGGGAGEINAGINVGTGPGEIYRDKTDENLNFKTLDSVQDTVTITNAADYIDLHVSPYTGNSPGIGADVYMDTTNKVHSFRTLRSLDGSLGITEFSNYLDLSVNATSKKIVNGSITQTIEQFWTGVGQGSWKEYTSTSNWTTRNMINCSFAAQSYRIRVDTTGNFVGTVTICGGLEFNFTPSSSAPSTVEVGIMINGSSPASNTGKSSVRAPGVNGAMFPFSVTIPVYNLTSASSFGIGIRFEGMDPDDNDIRVWNPSIIMDLREI